MEGKINFFFDEETDVLDITIGKPTKAIAKELKNAIAIRCDPKTGEIVGIVILNFRKRFEQKKKPERIELPLNVTIRTLISKRKKLPLSMFGANRRLNSFSE